MARHNIWSGLLAGMQAYQQGKDWSNRQQQDALSREMQQAQLRMFGRQEENYMTPEQKRDFDLDTERQRLDLRQDYREEERQARVAAGTGDVPEGYGAYKDPYTGQTQLFRLPQESQAGGDPYSTMDIQRVNEMAGTLMGMFPEYQDDPTVFSTVRDLLMRDPVNGWSRATAKMNVLRVIDSDQSRNDWVSPEVDMALGKTIPGPNGEQMQIGLQDYLEGLAMMGQPPAVIQAELDKAKHEAMLRSLIPGGKFVGPPDPEESKKRRLKMQSEQYLGPAFRR